MHIEVVCNALIVILLFLVDFNMFYVFYMIYVIYWCIYLNECLFYYLNKKWGNNIILELRGSN